MVLHKKLIKPIIVLIFLALSIPASAVVFICGSGTVAGGGLPCASTYGCETFENAYDQSWVDGGWDAKHGFVTEGFGGSASVYHDKGTNLSSGDDTAWTFSASATTAYVDGWVRFQDVTGLDAGGEYVIFVQVQTAASLHCADLGIAYITTESSICVRARYYNGTATVVGTTYVTGIAANTTYHYGLVYENDGSDKMEWYWSTSSVLGTVRQSESFTTARSPAKLVIGNTTSAGTGVAGAIDLEFDATSVDATAFDPVE